jgi:hypothetical protein
MINNKFSDIDVENTNTYKKYHKLSNMDVIKKKIQLYDLYFLYTKKPVSSSDQMNRICNNISSHIINDF